MNTGLLIAYFAKHEEARGALGILRRKGYLRTAWVSRRLDGGIHIGDPFRWGRFFGAAAAFLLFGCLAAVILMGLQWRGTIPAGSTSVPIAAVGSGIFGILLGVAWIRRSRFGVERALLGDHGRRLMSGETVLILQAPIEGLRSAVAALPQSGETPPAVFVLHPRREVPVEESWSPEALLNPAQLQERARRLAEEHRVDPKPQRNTELLRRLERSRRWIQQVCLDLSEAFRLERSMLPTAEWLLDNEYILESNARDVLLNLPRHYYRQLPVLASGPNRGLPRIYGLAQDLAAHSDLCLDE